MFLELGYLLVQHLPTQEVFPNPEISYFIDTYLVVTMSKLLHENCKVLQSIKYSRVNG